MTAQSTMGVLAVILQPMVVELERVARALPACRLGTMKAVSLDVYDALLRVERSGVDFLIAVDGCVREAMEDLLDALVVCAHRLDALERADRQIFVEGVATFGDLVVAILLAALRQPATADDEALSLRRLLASCEAATRTLRGERCACGERA